MVGLLALSLANLIALAAPAGTAAPPPTSTASQVTHPTWGDRLRPGTRFPIEGIAFDGRGGGAPLLPNFTTRARSANRRVEVGVASPSPGT
jgi:hypothetical protein